MTRRFLAALVFTTAAFALSLRADPVKVPAKDRASGPAETKDLDADRLAVEQRQLKQEFLEFKQSLLRLAQNLELSDKQENRDKAAMLRQALEKAASAGIDSKFNQLIEILRAPAMVKDLDKLGKAADINSDLRRDLQTLIRILTSDNRSEALKAERLRTEKMLEQLKDIIRRQERVRAVTEIGKKDPRDIAPDQDRVTQATKDLVRGGGKEGKTADGKDKAEGKGGGKEGKETAQGKKDTADDKGSGKDKEGNKDGKQGDGSKDGMSKDGSGKEGKDGQGKEGMGKEGQVTVTIQPPPAR